MGENPRIEDLRRRVQRDPASIAFAQLAEEHRRARQFQESVDVCRAGLVVHPAYVSARVTLGRSLIELGALDDAQRELQLVLDSAPDNLPAIRGLAEIHRRRGAVVAALAHYEAALRLAPNDPDLEQHVQDLTRAAMAMAQANLDPSRDAESGRAVRTIAALERWLEAIHGTGAERRA